MGRASVAPAVLLAMTRAVAVTNRHRRLVVELAAVEGRRVEVECELASRFGVQTAQVRATLVEGREDARTGGEHASHAHDTRTGAS